VQWIGGYGRLERTGSKTANRERTPLGGYSHFEI
jgi:hypothetical protein